LGGAINTVALLLFADFYNPIAIGLSDPFATTTIIVGSWLQIIGALILLILVPLTLSVIFSKWSPELQLVSPQNMQLISLAWVLYYLYTQRILVFGTIFLLGAYTILGGWVQDNIASDIVGQVASKDDIVTTSLIAETNLSNLQSILMTKKFRETLGLRKKIEETKRGIILRSTSDYRYQTIIVLEEGETEKKTFLDIAVFEKGKYALKMTEELKEFAKFERFRYLIGILRRMSIKCSKLSKQTKKERSEKLCDLVVDDLKGKVARIQEIPAISWIKLLGVFATITLCVVGYYKNWLPLNEMLGVLVPTTIYALFEFLPVKRGQEK
jgi:hypothetical protein